MESSHRSLPAAVSVLGPSCPSVLCAASVALATIYVRYIMTIMLQFVLLSPKMMSLNLDNVIFFSPNVFLVLIQLASRRRYVTKKEGNVYISRGSLYFRAHG